MRNLLLVGLLVAAPAFAQKPNYTRNQDVRLDVRLSDRVKQRPAPNNEKARPSAPPEMLLAVEKLLDGVRVEQEALLKKLIADTPDSEVDEKADYYFRLGELYAKQQRVWRLNSAERAIAADQAKTPAAKKQAQTESADAAKKAKDFMIAAVKTYKALTDNDAFKHYPKMDLALFYYGYTLQAGKYFAEARAVYDKLLKNYPNSKFVPEAHLAFADYYFEQNQYADAEARYKMVLKFPKTSSFWYANYKLGWIHLELQRYQEALETFFQVAQATKNDPKQEVLFRASKKDFVRAYAETGKADKAYNAFRRVDDASGLDMLATLADLYFEQGKSDKAIFTYRELMKLAPTNKDVCLWQYEVAHAMMSLPGATNGDKVKEIEDLVRLYSATKKKLPATEGSECRDNAAAMSGELARAYHSEFAKTQNPDLLANAERLYNAYLDAFPDASNFGETQFYAAEVMWSRAVIAQKPRPWELAAEAFTKVVKAGPMAGSQAKVDAKLLKEAAYAAVLAWKNALDIDPRVAKQAEPIDDKQYDTVPDAKPIPQREQKMLDAFDLYLTYVKNPNDEERIGITFLEGNLYRHYNQFDKAIPMFLDIVTNHKDHETAEFAANLLLDTYNRKHDYKAMVALAHKLAGDKQFLEGKEDLKERLAIIEIQSKRKEVEALEKQAKASGDFAKYVACGQGYMDIYNSNPEAKENDEVLYDALVCFHEGKSISAAITAFGLLERFYGKSKLMPRAVGRIGKAYGDIAWYELAAKNLEKYAKNYAGEDDAFTALGGATFYRKGLGQDDKAIDDTKFFIRTFGPRKPKEAANAAFTLTTVYEKQGDGDAVIKNLREYLRQFGSKGGDDRVVIAHAKIGQTLWDQSCPVKQIDGSCVKISREHAIALRGKSRNSDRKQCGPESKIKLTVVPRDERKVREAISEFAAAVAAFDKVGGKTGGDEAGARFYYAQSKLATADRDFETYLAMKFPQNLDFDKKNPAISKKSLQRFDGWVGDKTKAGAKAREQYETVLAIKDSASSIRAAARMGQLSQNFADALFTAEIPKDVRTGPYAEDKIEAFCDHMTEVAEPLEARSLEAYSVCLTKSTDLGWFSEWSQLCERELGQIKPEQYPTAAELRGSPSQVARIVTVEPPIAKLE